MRIFNFIFIYLLGGTLSAQQIYFSNFYEVSGYTNYTSSVVQKPDSGFIFINTDIGPTVDGYGFVSTDKYGDTLFTKNYYYASLFVSTGVTHSLIRTQDGNYLVCGTAIDTANVRDGWLIKFNPNGDTLWTKQYGGGASDYINSLYEDAQGHIWACGTTTSWGNGLGDFWLIHFDENGTALWDSTYGTAQNEGGICGELTPDGGIIMGGRQDGYPYIVKVDANGNAEWQYAYPNWNGYGYVSVAQDSGYIVACGKIISTIEDQGVILKLYPDGTEAWNRYVGFANTKEGLTAKPIVTNDAIVVGGMSGSQTSDYGGFIAKTDPEGYMIWQRSYTLDSTFNHYIYECLATSDGGYLLGGSTFQNSQNAWLIKVDSMGCESAGCDAVGIVEQSEQPQLSVFPNPAINDITIVWREDAESDLYAELVDATGQIVERILFDRTTSRTISTEQFAEGVYFIRIMSQGECLDTEKLIILR